MTTPKRQHWVPRFYLRQFLVPDANPKLEQVWVFNRKSGEPKLTGIKNIALENHLYSPKHPDGSRDPRLEMKLSDLEGTLAKLWPQLANGFVDLGSTVIRQSIALFLSVQFLRHPDRRDSAVGFRNRLIEFVEKQPYNSDRCPDIRQLKIGSRVYSIDASAWPNYRDAGDDLSVTMWRKMIEQDATLHAKMLMNKRWSIVFIDEPLFVTSDYPIFVPQPEFARQQIGGKNAMILFPISPTRILCFDDLDEPANQYYPIANSNADVYNMLTWVNTESFMISSRTIDGTQASKLVVRITISRGSGALTFRNVTCRYWVTMVVICLIHFLPGVSLFDRTKSQSSRDARWRFQ